MTRDLQPAGDTAAELDAAAFGRPAAGWRRKLYVIIFESDTRAGLLFDQVLLVAILASVTVVMLDSVVSVSSRYHVLLARLEWLAEFQLLAAALRNSRRKIAVFLSAVLMIVVTLGTVMYVVEGPANGFTSIPVSVYWAITTMTTVGFGDITPQTDFGRLIASVMMLMGWGVLAVPTGIVTAEMTSQKLRPTGNRACAKCGVRDHAADTRFCRACGASLEIDRPR